MPEDKRIKPLIGDQYWFERSQEMVQNLTSGPTEAAIKIQSMIGWFWGIYAAGATIGIALSKTTYSFPHILLIASPSVILIAAYWCAVWVQMPITVRFDHRAPEDIKKEYLAVSKTKNQRLKIAIMLSLTAAALVSSALFLTSINKATSLPTLQVYQKKIDGRNNIALSGHFPPNTQITLKISPSLPSESLAKWAKLVIVPSSGEIAESVMLNLSETDYAVTATWQEKNGLIYKIAKVISVGGSKEK